MTDGVSIVVPTIGRPSLGTLLDRLRPQLLDPPVPVELLVVRDEERHGPAAIRDRGWRAARYGWVAFLDDDVVPPPDWFAGLVRDLRQPPDVGGVQGRLTVTGNAGTDWAANTCGLEDAWWATADMAYRRVALERVGGFDERFPRAYREDADLAYRVTRLGYRLVRGDRRSAHPVRPESPWVSLRTQRGNADDALLRRLWGPRWHDLLAAPRGRRRRHAGTVALALAALGLTAARRPGPATLAALAWAALTVEFVAARRRAAPQDAWLPLAVTSVAIPPLAVGHWLAGWYRHRGARPWPTAGPGRESAVSAGSPAPARRRVPTP
jgi:hypothetical protein